MLRFLPGPARIRNQSPGGHDENGSNAGGSWGAAAGWMLTPKWGVQVDGTLVDSDVNYWNVGVKYHFQ